MKFVSLLPLNVRGVADKLLSGGQSCGNEEPPDRPEIHFGISQQFFNLQPGSVRAGDHSIFSCLLVNMPNNRVLACLDGLIVPWGSDCEMRAA
jgi:hypothetical protein